MSPRDRRSNIFSTTTWLSGKVKTMCIIILNHFHVSKQRCGVRKNNNPYAWHVEFISMVVMGWVGNMVWILLLLLSTSSSDNLYIPVSRLWEITLARIQSGDDGVTWTAAKSSGLAPPIAASNSPVPYRTHKEWMNTKKQHRCCHSWVNQSTWIGLWFR
jgi:hypothetical protein